MYTLEELKELKKTWLNKAEMGETFYDCRLIVERLGQEVEMPYPWNKSLSVLLYETNNTFFTLVGRSGKYLSSVKDFIRTTTLYVTVRGPWVATAERGLLVARKVWTNDPNHIDENLFVPGDWEEAIYQPLKDARKEELAEEKEGRELERQKLMKELLIREKV